MNALLGSMSLKEKIQVVLNQKGQFRCPSDSQTASTKPKAAMNRYGVVVANLHQRGAAKPKSVKTLSTTIRELFQKDITDKGLSTILQQLEADGVLRIDGTKVSYA